MGLEADPPAAVITFSPFFAPHRRIRLFLRCSVGRVIARFPFPGGGWSSGRSGKGAARAREPVLSWSGRQRKWEPTAAAGLGAEAGSWSGEGARDTL